MRKVEITLRRRLFRSLSLLAAVLASRCAEIPRTSGPSPTAAPRLNATEGYVQAAEGVRLFYRQIGRGTETLVFIHGGPGSNFRSSGEFMEPLAAGRTLIMYDQRGAGRSEIVTSPDRLGIADHIRDLEALRQEFGIERMTLIGLSWGSALAGAYAAEHPGRVSRLVLVSPVAPTRALLQARVAKLEAMLGAAAVTRQAELSAKLANAGDAETIALCRELNDITFRLYLAYPTPEKLRHAAKRCDIPPSAIRNRAIVQRAGIASLGDWDFRLMLARLTMPALVLEGERTNIPLDATRIWSDALPNARLELIPDAGHEFFVDQPAAFIASAERFLRSTPH